MLLQQTRPLDARDTLGASAWDALIASCANGHFLQCYAWGEFKAVYGWEPERIAVHTDTGTAAAQVLWRRTPLGVAGYVPRGPASNGGQAVDATRALLDVLHERARQRGAVFLKIEPNAPRAEHLVAAGFRPSRQTLQPGASLIIDLDRGLDSVAAHLHAKTRYNIRLASRKGVTVRVGTEDDLPAFQTLMVITGQRDGFTVRPPSYYRDLLRVLGGQAEALLAEQDGDLLAALLVTSFAGEALYLYGGSSGFKRNLMATYLVQWEAMRRAYGRGVSRYDLWGIPNELAAYSGAEGDELPEAHEHRRGDLWGVYRFKRGFGGSLVGYSGAFDYVYRPAQYWLWTVALPRFQQWVRRGKGGG